MKLGQRGAATIAVAVCTLLSVAQLCDAQQITTIQGYMQALAASGDPTDRAVLERIENGPTDLAHEKAAATAAGIALTNQIVSPPTRDNAAPLYGTWRADMATGNVSLPSYGDPLSIAYAYTPDQIAKVQGYMVANSDLFEEMLRATALPDVYVPPSGVGGATNFSVYAGMREAARQVDTESLLLSRAGRYSDAVTTQLRGMNIARQLNYQPSLIAYLVGNAIEAITLRGFQNILSVAGPSVAVDSQAAEVIREDIPTVSLKRMLAAEPPQTLTLLDRGRTAPPDEFIKLIGDISIDTPPTGLTETTSTPDEQAFMSDMIDAAEAMYIGRLVTVVVACDEPSTQRRAAFAKSAAIPDSDSPSLHSADFFQSLANSMIAILDYRVVQHDDQIHAMEQETLAAAQILSVKAQTGSFPNTLPGNYQDPFTGKPLGYRTEGAAGFVVYSAGPSGTFTGGKPGDKPSGYDTFFRYPAPAPVPVPA